MTQSSFSMSTSGFDPVSLARGAASPVLLTLIAAGVGLLLWNAAATVRLGERITLLEASLDKANDALATVAAAGTPGVRPGIATVSGRDMSSTSVDDAIVHLNNLKRAQGQVAPLEVARDLDSKIYMEPANPQQEQRAYQWLQRAETMTNGEDTPDATDVDTRCRGRRCLTRASFATEADASAWATQYLLNAGGTVLANSRTVIMPGQDGNRVTLQLYLY